MHRIPHLAPLTRLGVDALPDLRQARQRRKIHRGRQGAARWSGAGHFLLDQLAQQQGIEVCVVEDGVAGGSGAGLRLDGRAGAGNAGAGEEAVEVGAGEVGV